VPVEPAKPALLDRGVLLVGLLGVVVRVLYIATAGADPVFHHPIIDAMDYHRLGQMIGRGIDPWMGEFSRPPAYPYLLGGIYAVFGPSLDVARLFHALIGGGTCALTCLLGWRLFDRRAGLAAGVVVALYGPMILWDGRVLASCLVVFLFTLALYLAVRAADRPTWLNWLLCGCAVGAAALARPNIALLLIVLMCWLAGSAVRTRHWRALLAHTAALAVGSAGVVSIATLRNYLVRGEFVPIANFGGINLYLGNNPEAERTLAIRPGPEWDRLSRLPHADGAVSRRESEQYFVRSATEYMRTRPASFLRGLARKTRLFCASIEVPRNFDPYYHRRFSAVVAPLMWRIGPFGFPFGVVAPLAVAGMAMSWRERPVRRLAIGYVLAVAASVILFFNASRYRMPVVPVLAIFAVWAVFRLVRQAKARRYRQTAAGLVGVLAAGVLVSLPVTTPYDDIDFDADAHTWLGTVLRAEGDLEGAERALRHALARTPDSVAAHQILSQVAFARGRREEAVEHARRAVELDPALADTRLTLGQMLAGSGHRDAGVGQLRRALDIEPHHPHAHAALASLLMQRNDHEGAAIEWSEAIRFRPHDPQYHLGLARALLLANRPAEAVACLEAALSHTSEPEVIEALAWLLATCPDDAARDCDRALALATRLLEDLKDPAASLLDTLAAAYACAGRYDQALVTARRAAATARAAGDAALGAAIDDRARLYRQGLPCREPLR